jgi:membrane-bound serine protease (ClpP class)
MKCSKIPNKSVLAPTWMGNFRDMRRLAVLWLGLLLLLPVSARAQSQQAPLVLVLTANGPLTPAMSAYVARGLNEAAQRNAALVVLQLNTPGGSIDLMNEMVLALRASPAPVVVYIAPRGAMAGSAGTMITLAGHAAAMAPETTIGAASPVGSEGQDLGQTMQAKTKNILKATVRSLTEGRSARAVQLAEQTVDSAQAVSANEALQAGLVDFVASDINDLLARLDGFKVKTGAGEQTLHTQGAVVETFRPTLIEKLLSVLTNPAIAFLLITIGVQAILIEISTPGGWIAGFIGVVCLALAAYGMGVLPVNWFGLIFIVTAFVLFVLDIKAPTHGALTIAGVLSLIVGALVLFNSPGVPSFQRVPVPLVIGVSVAMGALFFVVMIFAVRPQKIPPLMGLESMVGRTGQARSDLAPGGIVQLGGEQWTVELAPGEESLPASTRVEVIGVKGLKLLVRKVR